MFGWATGRGSMRARQLAGRARAVGRPPGFEALEDVEDLFQKGFLFAVLAAAYRLERLVASMAVGAGAPMPVAYTTGIAATIAFLVEMEELGMKMGFEPWVSQGAEASILNLEAFDAVNWEALAERAGEAVDVDAWDAYAQERFPCGEDLSEGGGEAGHPVAQDAA